MQFLLQQLKPNFSAILNHILHPNPFRAFLFEEENMNDIYQLYCIFCHIEQQKRGALSLATLVCVSLKVILYQCST